MRAPYELMIQQTSPTQTDLRPKAAVPFVTTDLASAEMIKYAANAFLATKRSFINEISTICELVGAHVSSVTHGIGLDERIQQVALLLPHAHLRGMILVGKSCASVDEPLIGMVQLHCNPL